MRTERAASLRADLSLVAVTAIWGFTFPALQLALRDAGPLSFITARFALASLALALIFRRRVLRLTPSGLLYSLLLGLFLSAGTILQTLGLLHTTASRSAFITSFYVVLVPLIMLAVFRVRLRVWSLLAVPLAAAGLYLLTAPAGGRLNLGDLLTLGCALAFALHIIAAEAAAPRRDPVSLAFWQVLFTAAVSALALLLFEAPRFSLTPWTLTALLVTALLATALAFAVQMWAQRETSSAHVALIFTAEPVFAALFAALLQHERIGAKGLLGGALILVGIILSQVRARPRAARVGRPGGGRGSRPRGG